MWERGHVGKEGGIQNEGKVGWGKIVRRVQGEGNGEGAVNVRGGSMKDEGGGGWRREVGVDWKRKGARHRGAHHRVGRNKQAQHDTSSRKLCSHSLCAPVQQFSRIPFFITGIVCS